jgi:hypothetical protein
VVTGLQADPQTAVRRNYELALQAGERDAWEAFLRTYPDGFYAELAKVQLRKISAEEARVAAAAKAQAAEQEKARLAAEGAGQAEQAKAAAAAKAAEDARIAAEKAKQNEQEKAAAAEKMRLAEQDKIRLTAEKAKQAEQEKAAVAEQPQIAAGTQIRIRADFTAYRVRPQPRATRNQLNFTFTFAPDRSIKEEFSEPGPHKRGGRSESTWGQEFRMMDQNTFQQKIEFRDRIRTITINVTGTDCRATMTIELKPGFSEFEVMSTELGTKAYYRDWKMINSTCAIR